MNEGLSYYKMLDLPDVGDYASFFAVQSMSDETVWSYIFGLTLPSTQRYGGEGMLGDGIDYELASGQLEMPREVLEDGYYIMSARISDQRGDIYYAPVIGATVTDGKVTKWKLNPYFYGTPY